MKGGNPSLELETDEDPLVRLVNDAYESDQRIDELGIIMIKDNPSTGINGAVVVSPEHKLGICLWFIGKLYSASRQAFFSLWSKKQGWLDKSGQKKKLYLRRLSRASRSLLMINADFYTAWNARKWILLGSGFHLDDVLQELSFINLIFTKHPKAGEAWAHRGWLIRELIEKQYLDDSLIRSELEVCKSTADRYKRLYFSWKHRHMLVSTFTDVAQLQQEVDFTHSWMSMHISDYSAISYLQFVIFKLLACLKSLPDKTSDMINLVQREIQIANAFTSRYPSHLSLWLFQRFLYEQCCYLCPKPFTGKMLHNSVREQDAIARRSIEEKSDNNADMWWNPKTVSMETRPETCILTLEEQLVFALQICKKQLNNDQKSYGAISAVLNACILASKYEGKDDRDRIYRIIGHAALESKTRFTHQAWQYAMTRCLEIIGDFDSNNIMVDAL